MSALEVANKEKIEVANLKEQLSGAKETTINNYIAHFHETIEYDGIDLDWGVLHSEV